MPHASHYFFAVPMPAPIQKMLYEQSAAICEQFPYKQWTDKEDYHITLAFLGAVEDEQIEPLIAKVQASTIKCSPFSLAIDGIGTFGSPQQPRVLWAGVQAGDGLHLLHEEVSEASRVVGYVPEKRPYRPHITLAKKWNSEVKIDRDALPQTLKSEPWTAENFILYRIHPRQSPKYETVKSFQL